MIHIGKQWLSEKYEVNNDIVSNGDLFMFL